MTAPTQAPRLHVEIKFESHDYVATVIEAGQLTRFLAAKKEAFKFGTITGTFPEGVESEIATLSAPKPAATITKRKPVNMWLIKHISISTDSAGYMTATHRFQGTLIDSGIFSSRNECRQEAVKALRDLQSA